MNLLFINSEKNTTFHAYMLKFNLVDKVDLQSGDKRVALSHLSTYYLWKDLKKLARSNKFKISEETWHEEFELPDETHSI